MSSPPPITETFNSLSAVGTTFPFLSTISIETNAIEGVSDDASSESTVNLIPYGFPAVVSTLVSFTIPSAPMPSALNTPSL